jgi:hypothetical protein
LVDFDSGTGFGSLCCEAFDRDKPTLLGHYRDHPSQRTIRQSFLALCLGQLHRKEESLIQQSLMNPTSFAAFDRSDSHEITETIPF